MKLARFLQYGSPRLGVVEDGCIVDIFHDMPGLSADLVDWLPGGTRSWFFFQQMQRGAPRIPLIDVKLLAPIDRPSKYLALGANYRSHLEEISHLGIKVGSHQIWFNKQVSCITGPHSDVRLPRVSVQTDYEGELGVVIGRECHRIPEDLALNYVGGYLICNDVSVRDVQFRTSTMTLGKSFDTHGPMGPWLVTTDDIPDPQGLSLKTWVNGELRQDSHTGEMIYSVAEQIAELSHIMTLNPGDILATGTPAGVALGMKTPRYLQCGDSVRVQIQNIGTIENRFVLT